MAAQHNDLILFVGSGDLSHHVVTRHSIGHKPISNVELQPYRCSICQEPGDTAVILVAHHHCRDDPVDVVGTIAKCPYLAVLAPGIIYPNCGTIRDEKFIYLRRYLLSAQCVRTRRRWRALRSAEGWALRRRSSRVELPCDGFVRSAFCRRLDRHRND